MKSVGKILVLLGGFIWAIQYLFPEHNPLYVNFYAESIGVVGFVLIAAGAVFLSDDFSFPGGWTLVLAAVGALIVVQYFSGILVMSTFMWIGLYYVMIFWAAIVVGFNWRAIFLNNAQELHALMGMFVFSALLSACVAMLQWGCVDLHGIPVLGRYGTCNVVGEMGQRNQLATFMMVAFWITFFFELLRAKKSGYEKLFFISLELILLVAIALTASKTAVLSFLVCVAILSLKRKVIHGVGHVFYFLVCYLAVFFASPYVRPWIAGVAGESVSSHSAVSRWDMYRQVLSGLMSHPWMGYGFLGTFAAHNNGATVYYSMYSGFFSHNFLIDWVVWFGIPVGSFMIFLFVEWVRKILLSTKSEVIFFFVTICPVLIHSLLEYPFAYVHFLIILGVGFGCVQKMLNGGECAWNK